MTSYLDMPLNSRPAVLDKNAFLAKWNVAKSHSLVDFGLWGGLTPGNLDQMQDLTDCGVIGFKAFMSSSGVDDFPMADDGTLLEGMRRAFDLEQIVAVHAESEGVTSHLARQAVAEGRLSARDYLESRPGHRGNWRPSNAPSCSLGKRSARCTSSTSVRRGGWK